MKHKTILFAILLIGIVLLVGCTKSSTSGYAAYNSQPGQQQPYVGGGCGVAPADNTGNGDRISPVSINNL